MNGSIVIRDLIHAPIVGGIAGGTASFFTTNLAECLIVGLVAGAIQTVYQNKVEKSNAREGSILSTTSWFMFGGQALIGGIFCTIFHNIARSRPQNFVYSTSSLVKNPIHEIVMAIISALIGLFIGIIPGILIRIVSQ